MKEKERNKWALLVFFCQSEYGITHGSVLQLKMDKSQSVTASNYSERPGDANDLMPEEE